MQTKIDVLFSENMGRKKIIKRNHSVKPMLRRRDCILRQGKVRVVPMTNLEDFRFSKLV